MKTPSTVRTVGQFLCYDKFTKIEVEGLKLKYPCPCCDDHTLNEQGQYDICPKCNWEDDPDQSEYPDDDGGANYLSLNDARLEYRLSKNEITCQQANEAYQIHRKAREQIYLKYKDIDYRVDGEKFYKELQSESDRYVAALKVISEK